MVWCLHFKGSTVSRQASDKEKSKDLPTLKDNDFLSDRQVIHVGVEKRDKLLRIIKADTEVRSTFLFNCVFYL